MSIIRGLTWEPKAVFRRHGSSEPNSKILWHTLDMAHVHVGKKNHMDTEIHILVSGLVHMWKFLRYESDMCPLDFQQYESHVTYMNSDAFISEQSSASVPNLKSHIIYKSFYIVM